MNATNLADLFQSAARAHGDREAIIDVDRTYTYRELDAVVDRTAAHLLGLGVGPGDRLGLCLIDNADYLIVMIAAWRIGAIVVPVDWRSKGSERQAVVDRFDISLVIEHRPPMEIGGYPSARLDTAWHEAVVRTAPVPAAATRHDDSVAILTLSSGTTGQSTGFPATHRGIHARNKIIQANCGIGEGTRLLLTLPLNFSVARIYAIACLVAGGTVIHHGPMIVVDRLCAMVRRHAVSHLCMVPNMVRTLLYAAPKDRPLLPELDCLMCLGAILPAAEKCAAKERVCPNFYESYGASSGGPITYLRPEDIPDHAESVGRAGIDIDVEVVDEDDLPLPADEIGLLRYRSASTAVNQAAVDAAAVTTEIVKDGWHYPGDLARIDKDGFVYIVGRTADIIIRGGGNIYPVEIENVLAAHPAVEEAAVVAWESPELGEEVAAFVVLREATDKADLTAWCRRNLGPAKQPRDIFFRDTMPRNTNGKILKRELKAELPPIG